MLNSIKKFFWMCSGADLSILGRPECDIEQNKYVGIGATILSTAVLAAFSGGYALYTVFGASWESPLFGLMWGLIIFNLDRYIVSTMKRTQLNPDTPALSQPRPKINEIAKVTVRFLLAIFISLIITKPLELKLFAKEITAQLESDKSARLADSRQSVNAEFPDIARLEAQNQRLSGEIKEKEKKTDNLHELAMDEAIGKPGENTTGRIGKGIVYNERWAAYEASVTELAELRRKNEAEIAMNGRRITELRAAVAARGDEVDRTIKDSGGLLEQLKTLSALAAADSTVAWSNRFLILLFIMLETAPMFVKLLSDRGPYDDFYETAEHQVHVEQQKKMAHLNDEARNAILLNRQQNADLLAAGIDLSQSLRESLATVASVEIREARQEVSSLHVARWKKAEIDKLKKLYPASNHDGNGHHAACDSEAVPPEEPAPDVEPALPEIPVAAAVEVA